ncbi:MAG: matrixin family metalloprotease, partial [Alphaproteobacteria bacterium]|nr:matrixin family metalloprotease [Alphaproteobacteria bacterium]
FLSTLPASAAGRDGPDDGPAAYGYTDHDSRATQPRIFDLYIDRDFSDNERDDILFAVKQWNYALNGFIRFRTSLLPPDVPKSMVAEIRQRGGWIVARVDSHHPVAQQGEGLHALAVTLNNGRTGMVYVISDRIGGRNLSGVVMHEFGHVLGAGHDHAGLMAPVYNAAGARCIDHDAMAMVAQVQRLPMSDLNWCEPPTYRRGPPVMSQR